MEKEKEVTYSMEKKDLDPIISMKLLNPRNWEESRNAPEPVERRPAKTTWEEMPYDPNHP